jgi:hypothetical protein
VVAHSAVKGVGDGTCQEGLCVENHLTGASAVEGEGVGDAVAGAVEELGGVEGRRAARGATAVGEERGVVGGGEGAGPGAKGESDVGAVASAVGCLKKEGIRVKNVIK